MRDDGIVAVVESLVGCDPAVMEGSEVDATLVLLRRLRGWVDAGVLGCTRRLNELAASSCASSTTSNQALIDQAGQSARDALATQERVDLCDRDAGLEDSLAAGAVTAGHLDVIARFARKLDGDALAEYNSRLSEFRDWASGLHVSSFEIRLKAAVRDIAFRHRPLSAEEELERQRAGSSMREWVESETGLHKFLLTMDPFRAASFRTAIRAELAALRAGDANKGVPFGSLQIDAVNNAVSGGAAVRRVPEVVVHIDLDTLLNGENRASLCETDDGDSLPVGLVRQLCADALLIFSKTDQYGQIHDTIEARTANRRQRRALSSMHRSCSFPGCTVPAGDCRAHHVTWVSRGGRTRLGELIPVCEAHHHAIHDDGWICELNEITREISWTPPNGDVQRITRPDRRHPARC